MIYKPAHLLNTTPQTPLRSIHYESDKEKIDKVVKFAKELGLEVYIGEAPDKMENNIMIKIPYKKIELFAIQLKAEVYKEEE